MDIEKSRTKLQQKVGRNLLLFQEMELNLKRLIRVGNFVIEAESPGEKPVILFPSVDKQTMGAVAKKYLDQTYKKAPEKIGNRAANPVISLSIIHEIDAPQDHIETKGEELKALLDERNELVHHFLEKTDINSFEACETACLGLDDQRDRINAAITDLANMFNEIKELLKSGLDTLVTMPSEHEVIELLKEIATQTARTDGLTTLSEAGQRLSRQAPFLMGNLQGLFGHKNLKSLIQAAGCFDLFEEATNGGGVRLLYRTSKEPRKRSDQHPANK